MHQGSDPHGNTPVMATGAPLDEAKAVMIMIHGRGASAQDILSLSAEFGQTEVAYIAPQAAASTWYPYRFIEPTERNEPSLTSALNKVDVLVNHVVEQGFPVEKIMLLGFSQGACLASEYMARNPRRYGGLAVLSGGLIGDTLPDYANKFDYGDKSLEGTPVFIGCSDVDFHIPESRVHETTDILKALGADVTERIYPGMDHTINQDELNHVKALIEGVLS